ncbi:MAG: folate family ECF transporter S component [Eubacteriales bacterium]|nr:folate family ECF transporter S component [Eubacteriales bacterium]
MKSSDIKKTAVSGLLIALDVLFTRVLAINTPVMKIGLGFLAVALCGALYGPVWAAVCGALGDFLGSLIFPTGAYFPGFTLTAAITGLIFGFLLKKYSVGKALTAAALNVVLVTFLANTAMIAYISGAEYSKLLGTRAVQIAVMLPVQAVALAVILPVIMKGIRRNGNI